MQRFLLSCANWLMLVAVLLNSVAAFRPLDSYLIPSSTFTFTQSPLDCSDWLFKHTSSVSHKLNLRCTRQSKNHHALLHSFTILSHLQEKDARLRSASVPVFFPT